MSEEILIASYLGSDNVTTGPQFVTVNEFEGTISNRQYIEGAIELVVHGEPLISKAEWDLLDQLWIYLIQGAEAVAKGEEFSCRFPDHPRKILQKPLAPDRVLVRIGEQSATAQRTEWIAAIAQGAIDCLTRLGDIIADEQYFATDIARAKSLLDEVG